MVQPDDPTERDDPPLFASRRASHASLAVFLVALLLLAASITQVAFRLSLPTEGWAYTEGEIWAITFTDNLLGDPSPLRPGDRLLAVEGVAVEAMSGDRPNPTIADQWTVGQTARYTILRDETPLDLDVPLKGWTASAALRHAMGSVQGVAEWLTMLAMLAIGVVVWLKRPGDAAARALLLLATIWAASGVTFLIPDGPTTRLSVIWPLAAFFGYWIYGALIGPTVLALALVFPRPKRVLQRRPWLVLAPYLPFWLLVAAFGLLPAIGWGLTGLCFVLALLSVLHSAVTLRDAVSRAQLLWGLGGFLAMIGLFLPAILLGVASFFGGPGPAEQSGLLGALVEALSVFSLPVFTACLAVAIVRHRLFDIEVIIRRTLVYTVLTMLLALVYMVSVLTLQALLGSLTGPGRSDLVIIVSTLASAAVFQPLRRRTQTMIDRRFYRRRHDAAATIAAFGGRLRDEVDLPTFTQELLAVVRETMQPASISLWIRPSDPARPAPSPASDQE